MDNHDDINARQEPAATATIKKRSPLLAFVLSAIFTGVGQIYNGQALKGIIFYFILLAFYSMLIGAKLFSSFKGLVIWLSVYFVLWLGMVVDAVVCAARRKDYVLKPYNKWYVYIMFVAMVLTFSAVVEYSKTSWLTFKAFKMSAGAMAPTLKTGDHLMVDMRATSVHRGDIIVFLYPEDESRDFIKRVVAIGGDTVQIVDKALYVNSSRMDEPYVMHSDPNIMGGDLGLRDNFGPVTVPDGMLFTLGDNRDDSHDSRFWGYVSTDKVIGKALYIYWSTDFDRIGTQIK